jgi:hypothetical protein
MLSDELGQLPDDLRVAAEGESASIRFSTAARRSSSSRAIGPAAHDRGEACPAPYALADDPVA